MDRLRYDGPSDTLRAPVLAFWPTGRSSGLHEGRKLIVPLYIAFDALPASLLLLPLLGARQRAFLPKKPAGSSGAISQMASKRSCRSAPGIHLASKWWN